MLLLFISPVIQAQQVPQRITIEAAIDTALRNNLQYAVNKSEISRAGINVKTANDIPKTDLFEIGRASCRERV